MTNGRGNIAVIGSGPSGLMAAWAVIEAGYSVKVYSPEGAPSDRLNAGVFVLHDACKLPVRASVMEISGFGGMGVDYKRKVYGDLSMRVKSVSFPQKPRAEIVYDAQQAFALIKDIIPSEAYAKWEYSKAEFEALRVKYDGVVWTAPRRIVANEFTNTQFETSLDCVMAWVKTSQAPPEECYTLYNAHPDIYWYRASAAFGRFTIETTHLPFGITDGDWQMVKKVIPPFPKSRVGNVLFAGRFGAWDKSQTHDVFQNVGAWLEDGCCQG